MPNTRTTLRSKTNKLVQFHGTEQKKKHNKPNKNKPRFVCVSLFSRNAHDENAPDGSVRAKSQIETTFHQKQPKNCCAQGLQNILVAHFCDCLSGVRMCTYMRPKRNVLLASNLA